MASKKEDKHLKTFENGRFVDCKQIGSGGFGDVFRATDTLNDCQQVAIKASRPELFLRRGKRTVKEASNRPSPVKFKRDLKHEYIVLDYLKNLRGFPEVYKLGKRGEETYLAMELLGPSIDSLFRQRHRIFSIKTVIILVDQLLERLQMMHYYGIIHGDIKPANILVGTGENSGVAYLIDFGLTSTCRNLETGEHLPYRISPLFSGTFCFMSQHSHKRIQRSRRDDLESLAYVFAYLLRRGDLPWAKLELDMRYNEIESQKREIKAEKLFAGQPKEFAIFCHEVKSLKYTQRPKYEKYRKMFRRLGVIFGVNYNENGDGFARLPF